MSLAVLPDAFVGEDFTTVANEWLRVLGLDHRRRGGKIIITNTDAVDTIRYMLPDNRAAWMGRFEGGNDELSANSVVPFLNKPNGSIVARVRLDEPTSGASNTFFALNEAATVFNSINFGYVGVTNILFAEFTDGSGSVRWRVEADNPFSTATWLNVELFHDGTRPFLKLDGVIIPQGLTTNLEPNLWFRDLQDTADAVDIGYINLVGTPSNHMEGDIDTISIYTGYDGAPEGKTLVAEYLFCDSPGISPMTITDTGPNGVDATFTFVAPGGVTSKAVGTAILPGQTVTINDIPKRALDLWLFSTAAIVANVQEFKG